MHHTVAGDRWKALKMSARKLARDARARRRPPAHPRPAPGARAGDWHWPGNRHLLYNTVISA